MDRTGPVNAVFLHVFEYTPVFILKSTSYWSTAGEHTFLKNNNKTQTKKKYFRQKLSFNIVKNPFPHQKNWNSSS